ncbi:hypothetical protein Q1J45_10605 [Pseudomonas rhodesiae]
MELLTPSIAREIHEIINKRIIKAPNFIKSEFGFNYKNQKIFIDHFNNTIFVSLLNPLEIKSLKRRQRRGIPNFPALITDEPNTAFFRLENSTKTTLKNISLCNNFALSVGENSSMIIEQLTIELENTDVGNIKYTIDLGFIVRLPEKEGLYSLTETLDDLVVYYIKNAREDASHALAI